MNHPDLWEEIMHSLACLHLSDLKPVHGFPAMGNLTKISGRSSRFLVENRPLGGGFGARFILT